MLIIEQCENTKNKWINSMGRPKLKESEKGKRTNVYFPSGRIEEIKKEAKKQGMKFSQFLNFLFVEYLPMSAPIINNICGKCIKEKCSSRSKNITMCNRFSVQFKTDEEVHI